MGLAATPLSGQGQGRGEQLSVWDLSPIHKSGSSLVSLRLSFPTYTPGDLQYPSRGMILIPGQGGDTEQHVLTRATATDVTYPPAGTREKVLGS